MTKRLPDAMRDDPAIADATEDALAALWSELLGKDAERDESTKAVAVTLAKAQVAAIVAGDAERVARLERSIDLVGELARVKSWERRDNTRLIAIAIVRFLAKVPVIA